MREVKGGCNSRAAGREVCQLHLHEFFQSPAALPPSPESDSESLRPSVGLMLLSVKPQDVSKVSQNPWNISQGSENQETRMIAHLNSQLQYIGTKHMDTRPHHMDTQSNAPGYTSITRQMHRHLLLQWIHRHSYLCPWTLARR